MDQSDEDSKWGELWARRDILLQRIQVSSLYHRRRERFFEAWDRLSKAVTIIVGSAALVKAVPEVEMLWIGAAAVIPTTLALVFGLGDKARRHAHLAARFKGLEAAMARVGVYDFTEEQVNSWTAECLDIEGTEPRALSALVRICERQVFSQRGRGEKAASLTFFQRALAHYWDFQELKHSPRSAS